MKSGKMGIHREKRECQERSTSAPIVAVFVKESVPGKKQEEHNGRYAGEQHSGRNAPEQACGRGGNWSDWSFRGTWRIKNADAGEFAGEARGHAQTKLVAPSV